PQRLLSMSRRADSLLLHVGLQEPWGAAPRIALAHAMVQTWIGGVLWIGPDDAAHEAESYWFSEGVARYFAREILFRVGLLDPDEYRDAIALDLAIAFTSRRKGESNAALAAHVADEGALGLLVARGSLYALGASARIRQRTAGKRSLDAVMLALFERGRAEKRRVLPTSAWLDAIATEGGEAERAAFERSIGEGRAPALPSDALGPCFRRGQGRYPRFDVGFDEAATLASKDHVILGLERGGPAERAGLRAGDALVRSTRTPDSVKDGERLEVRRGDKTLELRYLPVGESYPGDVWTRVAGIPNEKCKP
ncbi:MAG TPA: hypothetical protein VGM56_27510, partial [Byssovorax sp.]